MRDGRVEGFLTRQLELGAVRLALFLFGQAFYSGLGAAYKRLDNPCYFEFNM